MGILGLNTKPRAEQSSLIRGYTSTNIPGWYLFLDIYELICAPVPKSRI